MAIDEYKSLEILEGDIDDLKFVYQRIERDFSAKECKNYQQLFSLMKGGKYQLLLARDPMLNYLIGYAFVYKINDPHASWLDYVAIDVPYQNLGYGTQFFNKIIEYYQEFLGLFFEVEIPDKENLAFIQQIRRIKFYERLGAQKVALNYKCPTVDDGLPMYLYFWPSPGTLILHKEQIQVAISAVYDDVHSDQPHRNEVLQSFYSTIQDVCFSEPFA